MRVHCSATLLCFPKLIAASSECFSPPLAAGCTQRISARLFATPGLSHSPFQLVLLPASCTTAEDAAHRSSAPSSRSVVAPTDLDFPTSAGRALPLFCFADL